MHSVFINWLSRWWVLKKSSVCLFIIQTLVCTIQRKSQNFFCLLCTLVDCRWGSLVAQQICRQYSTSMFFSDETPFVSVQLWIGITARFGGRGGIHTSCVSRRESAKINMVRLNAQYDDHSFFCVELTDRFLVPGCYWTVCTSPVTPWNCLPAVRGTIWLKPRHEEAP